MLPPLLCYNFTVLLRPYVKKLVTFHFVSVKMVYRILLESISTFQCVSDTTSHLYHCIWYYYKNKFVIQLEKILLLHTQTSLSYCPLILVCLLPSLLTTPHIFLL